MRNIPQDLKRRQQSGRRKTMTHVQRLSGAEIHLFSTIVPPWIMNGSSNTAVNSRTKRIHSYVLSGGTQWRCDYQSPFWSSQLSSQLQPILRSFDNVIQLLSVYPFLQKGFQVSSRKCWAPSDNLSLTASVTWRAETFVTIELMYGSMTIRDTVFRDWNNSHLYHR